MPDITRDPTRDSTFALPRDPYALIWKRCQRYRSALRGALRQIGRRYFNGRRRSWRAGFLVALPLLLAGCEADPGTSNTPSAPNPAKATAAAKLGFAVPETAQPVAALQFAGGGGQLIRLEDFRGKVVLLNVWATWCPPCRKEMPTLDRLQAALGGPAFEVLALSIDHAGIDAVKAFYRDIGLKHLRVYVDPSSQAMTALNVLGIPTTLLLDPEGHELARLTGTKEWDSPEILALLKEIIAKTGNGANAGGADPAPGPAGRASGSAKAGEDG